MSSDSTSSVYSDARAEYTNQLYEFLVPAYFQFYLDLLNKAKETMATDPKRILWQFQTYLDEIRDWNMEKVNQEISILQKHCGCDYLDDLLVAVFIAHTKVLMAIKLATNNKKVDINVPKVDHFLFKVLCETSKLLWQSTYLFRENVSTVEKQQNYRAIEGLLREGIMQAVRGMVPVKSILRDVIHTEPASMPITEAKPSSSASMDADADGDDSDEDTPAIQPAIQPIESSVPSDTVVAHPSSPVLSTPTPASTPMSAPIAPTTLPPILLDLPENNNQVASVAPSTPTIILDEKKPSVQFGHFDTVFGIDNPADSDMIYDPKSVPELEVLEDLGDLSEGSDFLNLDHDPLELSEPMNMTSEDYEVL